MILADLVPAGAAVEQIESALDERPVPARAVLLLEQQQGTVFRRAAGQPRRVKAHQRQEGERPRRRAHRMPRQRPAQPHRLGAEFLLHRLAAAVVALRKQQIERVLHRLESLLDLRAPGDLVQRTGARERLLAAGQQLLHGGLTGQQRRRDLGCSESVCPVEAR